MINSAESCELPRVLIIDDQYGWDIAKRKKLKKDLGLICSEHLIADVMFCAGQTKADGVIKNDYGLIRKTIADKLSASWAMILLDVRFDSGRLIEDDITEGLPGDDSFGETIRARLLADFPCLPLVMLTSKHQSELQDNAHPFLSKTGLTPRIFSQCLLQHGRLTPEQRRVLLGLDPDSVAFSPLTLELFRQADAVADRNVPVFLLGETGSGKEVLAQYIHKRSGRKADSFFAKNVSAIPATLVEAELFGIGKKVASQVDARPGMFELADGGTLFLDEIGDMPIEDQVKTLRVLQQKEVVRVGTSKAIPINVRVLCATSRNVNNSAFRPDLLRRLGCIVFTVPPLRDRREDIIPLSKTFIERFSTQYDKVGITIGPDAMAELIEHPFLGNVGELENVIHGLVATVGNNRVISASEMKESLASSMSAILCKVEPPLPQPEIPSTPEKAQVVAGDLLHNLLQSLKSFLVEKTENVLAQSEQTVEKPPAVTSLTEEAQVHQASFESLDGILQILKTFQVKINDPELPGAKQKVEEAMFGFLKRLAGASLEICRDQCTKELNRQAAMKFFTGDHSLKGKGPARVINDILGRHVETAVTSEDLEALVTEWREQNKEV